MAIVVPKCPFCGNDKAHYIVRDAQLMAEDTLRPKPYPHPGAGTTHPAFDLVQIRATSVWCRQCGIQFWPDLVQPKSAPST